MRSPRFCYHRERRSAPEPYALIKRARIGKICSMMSQPNDQQEPFDPIRDDHAYFLGLLATDGHIYETSRNRGRIAFELASRDASVLTDLAERIPYRSHLTRRRRATNFKTSHESAVLVFHDLGFRRTLARLRLRCR